MAAALAGCAATPAHAAATTAQAQAVTVAKLSLLKLDDLDFGDLASGATAGTATINPDTGARTVTGGVTQLGGTFGPAEFLGAGTPNKTVLVREPNGSITLTRSGGTETMTVSNFTVNGGNGTSRKIGADGTLRFFVGGRLNVGANQAQGTYLGTFTVTVDYT